MYPYIHIPDSRTTSLIYCTGWIVAFEIRVCTNPDYDCKIEDEYSGCPEQRNHCDSAPSGVKNFYAGCPIAPGSAHFRWTTITLMRKRLDGFRKTKYLWKWCTTPTIDVIVITCSFTKIARFRKGCDYEKRGTSPSLMRLKQLCALSVPIAMFQRTQWQVHSKFAM